MRELIGDRADQDRELPHGALVATANQTAGRGRQGRDWVTPPDTAIAASLLVRADLQSGLGLSWLPLLAGSAVTRALQPLFASVGSGADSFDDADELDRETLRVGVKWPNDVHVRGEQDAIAGRPGAKLCGILCEVVPAAPTRRQAYESQRGGATPDALKATPAVIVGFGVNLLQEDWQLPTERAGSLLACGADVGGAETLADPRGEELADHVLASISRELLRLVDLAVTDPAAARRTVLRDSLTLGAEVRVHLPGGEVVDGRAVGLDEDGALIVDRPTTGQLIVNAADVEHLR